MITNCFLVTSLRIGAFIPQTARLRVLLNLTSALESEKLALVTLWDMSTAFDTVNHEVLLRCLDATYSIWNGTLMWIASYPMDRTEKVHVNGYTSPNVPLNDVPKGSVLGPLQFIMYTGEL